MLRSIGKQHMAQLMPLPLTVSWFSKIQIGFTFLVPAHPGSPGKRAVKRVRVCVTCTVPRRVPHPWILRATAWERGGAGGDAQRGGVAACCGPCDVATTTAPGTAALSPRPPMTQPGQLQQAAASASENGSAWYSPADTVVNVTEYSTKYTNASNSGIAGCWSTRSTTYQIYRPTPPRQQQCSHCDSVEASCWSRSLDSDATVRADYTLTTNDGCWNQNAAYQKMISVTSGYRSSMMTVLINSQRTTSLFVFYTVRQKKRNQFSFVCVSFNTWQRLVNFLTWNKERVSNNSMYLILACIKCHCHCKILNACQKLNTQNCIL